MYPLVVMAGSAEPKFAVVGAQPDLYSLVAMVRTWVGYFPPPGRSSISSRATTSTMRSDTASRTDRSRHRGEGPRFGVVARSEMGLEALDPFFSRIRSTRGGFGKTGSPCDRGQWFGMVDAVGGPGLAAHRDRVDVIADADRGAGRHAMEESNSTPRFADLVDGAMTMSPMPAVIFQKIAPL